MWQHCITMPVHLTPRVGEFRCLVVLHCLWLFWNTAKAFGAGDRRRWAWDLIVNIYCCGCKTKVDARLTDGAEIYPHRQDLSSLPFWRCDTCGNYVGCHHKTKNRTKPLGCIPTPEIKNARQYIHKILDPIWKSGRISREELYANLSDQLGWEYHTANIKSIEEARRFYRLVCEYAKQGDWPAAEKIVVFRICLVAPAIVGLRWSAG